MQSIGPLDLSQLLQSSPLNRLQLQSPLNRLQIQGLLSRPQWYRALSLSHLLSSGMYMLLRLQWEHRPPTNSCSASSQSTYMAYHYCTYPAIFISGDYAALLIGCKSIAISICGSIWAISISPSSISLRPPSHQACTSFLIFSGRENFRV
jgi:hypothetical protein